MAQIFTPAEYMAENGRTKLVDLTIEDGALHAPPEKIAARPYPGINIDNLPFSCRRHTGQGPYTHP